jgi:hypothetical protein
VLDDTARAVPRGERDERGFALRLAVSKRLCITSAMTKRSQCSYNTTVACGSIINELFEDDARALQLKFYGYFGLRGKQPGGPEEQAEQALLSSDKGYQSALLSTLKRTRELLAEGKL